MIHHDLLRKHGNKGGGGINMDAVGTFHNNILAFSRKYTLAEKGVMGTGGSIISPTLTTDALLTGDFVADGPAGSYYKFRHIGITYDWPREEINPAGNLDMYIALGAWIRPVFNNEQDYFTLDRDETMYNASAGYMSSAYGQIGWSKGKFTGDGSDWEENIYPMGQSDISASLKASPATAGSIDGFHRMLLIQGQSSSVSNSWAFVNGTYIGQVIARLKMASPFIIGGLAAAQRALYGQGSFDLISTEYWYGAGAYDTIVDAQAFALADYERFL